MFCDEAVDSSRRRFVACSTGIAAAFLPKALMFRENTLNDELVGLDFIEVMPTLDNEMIVADAVDYDAPFEPEYEPMYEPVFEPEILTDTLPSKTPRAIASNAEKTQTKAKLAKQSNNKKVIAHNKKPQSRGLLWG